MNALGAKLRRGGGFGGDAGWAEATTLCVVVFHSIDVSQGIDTFAPRLVVAYLYHNPTVHQGEPYYYRNY